MGIRESRGVDFDGDGAASLTQGPGYPNHNYELVGEIVRRLSGRARPACPSRIPTTLASNLGSRERQARPSAASGLATTPLDMTVFGQAFLRGGRYGDARTLSRAAVAAMTRDQIPGLRALVTGMEFEHASCGYGWVVASPGKWKYFDSSLHPLGTFSHPGARGAMVWIAIGTTSWSAPTWRWPRV